jgi:hypothetical protein
MNQPIDNNAASTPPWLNATQDLEDDFFVRLQADSSMRPETIHGPVGYMPLPYAQPDLTICHNAAWRISGQADIESKPSDPCYQRVRFTPNTPAADEFVRPHPDFFRLANSDDTPQPGQDVIVFGDGLSAGEEASYNECYNYREHMRDLAYSRANKVTRVLLTILDAGLSYLAVPPARN